jgi:hypothetical protein
MHTGLKPYPAQETRRGIDTRQHHAHTDLNAGRHPVSNHPRVLSVKMPDDKGNENRMLTQLSVMIANVRPIRLSV